MKNDAKSKVEDSSKRVEELEKSLRELAATIDKVEDEKLEIKNKLMKALADYQNLERSIDQRVETKLAQLKRKVASSIIEIIDDLKFGKDAAGKLNVDNEGRAWLEGMLSTMNKMEKAIGELGISLIEVKAGDQFDSSIHEAIGTLPGKQENVIADLVQPGYMMGDSVVRAARVIVYKNNLK